MRIRIAYSKTRYHTHLYTFLFIVKKIRKRKYIARLPGSTHKIPLSK